jgi:hypothetical protein
MVEKSLNNLVLNQVDSGDYLDGKGLTANKDIGPNQALFAVPLSDLLTLDRIKEENGTMWKLIKGSPEIFDETDPAFELVVITLYLMHESLEPESEWADYMNAQMDAKFFCDWADSHQFECQDMELIASADEEKTDIN